MSTTEVRAVRPPRMPTISLDIRVSDGSYETRLTFPVDASKEAIHNIMAGWFQAIDAALKATEIANVD